MGRRKGRRCHLGLLPDVLQGGEDGQRHADSDGVGQDVLQEHKGGDTDRVTEELGDKHPESVGQEEHEGQQAAEVVLGYLGENTAPGIGSLAQAYRSPNLSARLIHAIIFL